MRDEPPAVHLPYASAAPARRFSRLAIVSCLWSVITPLGMLGVSYATADIVDDWFDRPVLFLFFAVLTLWAPLAGVAFGGVALGRVRARPELRGAGLAVVAIVIGAAWAIALAWLLAIAYRL